VEGFARVIPREVSGILERVARSTKFFVSLRDPRKCLDRSVDIYIIFVSSGNAYIVCVIYVRCIV